MVLASLAAGSTYLSYAWEESRSILASVMAALFWVGTLVQWSVDHSASGLGVMAWIFLAPLTLNVVRLYEVAISLYSGDGYKADPFK